jgi:hypothetical protein
MHAASSVRCHREDPYSRGRGLPPNRLGISMLTGRTPHLTMRWSERRTAVRLLFEMTSTRPVRATRAIVRRRSSYSR